MNNQSLIQSRVTNILEVAKRENLEHVVIATEYLKTMQNIVLELQRKIGVAQLETKQAISNAYGLQAKLDAANQVNESKLRTIDSLKEKLQQSEDKLKVYASTFGANFPKPVRFGVIPVNYSNAENCGPLWGVKDFPSVLTLPFKFAHKEEAQTLADVLNSFITK